MRILLLINWKIRYCNEIPEDLQPSDYNCPQELFWFFRYFKEKPEVDVVDISAPKWIERVENKLRFHFYQTLRVLHKINKYDLIFVHGTTSAMLLGAIKRLFPSKIPPILDVDISSFRQASTKGLVHKLSQFSSKAFDYMVYHASSQMEYYKEQFPWLVEKSEFVHLGVDYNYWKTKNYPALEQENPYIVCVGYRKRDWNTLLKAFSQAKIKEKLYLIGNPALECNDPDIKVMPFIPINELMTYITNAKFSVIPLDDFNYSFAQLTLLQQMALGVPILAADVCAIRDYIGQSKGCVSYEPYNAEDLTKKLVQMSGLSAESIREMAKQNVEAVKMSLSEHKMAEKLEEICRKLVNK